MHEQAVAIIGIGCRFPGADGPDAFWSLLERRGSGIAEIPANRWSLEGFYDPDPGAPDRSYAKWAGLIQGIRAFDPAFFQLSHREAAAMDPQQRVLLQVAYEAVADSGNTLRRLSEAETGVFIGVSNADYGLLQRHRPDGEEPFAGTNVALSIVPNRLSNRFDFSGPSVGIDTACSSSLVALNQACHSLAAGECEVALAGGVNLLLDPRMFKTFCKARMLSPSGRIAAFDARADGFVRGEGAGVVVLKPLDRALHDGDRVYAVVRASRVNQDGRTGTITAPNQAAQVAILEALCKQAGVDPQQVIYAEAHGTGTPLGDPIEAAAIGRVFGGPQRHAPLILGSVKPNIGHLEPAAGIAGLIKTTLSLHRRRILPSAHFDTPNPEIPFDALNLEVATAPRSLTNGSTRALALVNSFGFGGTNACALLEAFDGGPQTARPGRSVADILSRPVPVPVSAATETALQRGAGRLADAFATDAALQTASCEDCAARLARDRDHFRYRAVALAEDRDGLVQTLRKLEVGELEERSDWSAPRRLITGQARRGRRLAITMSGQGGQWWGMGRQLLTSHPVYREFAETFDAVFRPVAGWSAVEALLASEGESRVDDAAVTPALVFVVQAGLAEVWKAWGVTPDLLIGHSFGEVTAAYLADALSLETVAHLVNERGLIRARIGTEGGMAAIGLAPDRLAERLPPDGGIEIAAYNAPTLVTVSGDGSAIDGLIADLAREDPDIVARRLNLDFAWHSSWLAPGEQFFKNSVGQIACEPPSLPVLSTVTGRPETCFDTDHWWCNLRQPVLYYQAVDAALDRGIDTFLELGPHRTLSSLTAGCAAARGKDVKVVSALHRDREDFEALVEALAELHVWGIDVDWDRVFLGPRPHLPLPGYAWDEETFWQEPEEARTALGAQPYHALLGTWDHGPTAQWSNEVSLSSHRYLADHELDGMAVFPAACTIEMMVAAARALNGPGPIELADVTFHESLAIGPDDSVQLRTVYQEDRGALKIYSRCRERGPDWTLRSEAKLVSGPLAAVPDLVVEPPTDRGPDISGQDFYASAQERGYRYGPSFRGLAQIWCCADGVIASTRMPDADKDAHARLSLDPQLLDSCLQTLIVETEDIAPNAALTLPTRISRLRIDGELGADAWVRTSWGSGSETGSANLRIWSPSGGRVTIEDLQTRRLPARIPGQAASSDAPAFYGESFHLVSLPMAGGDIDPSGANGQWLVFAEPGPGADAFKATLTGRGGAVKVCRLPEADQAGAADGIAALAHTLSEEVYRGIIYVAAPSSAALPTNGHGDLAGAVERTVLAFTALAQALEQARHDLPVPPVWIVTQKARQATSDETIGHGGLIQRPLVGLARTLAMECPELDVRLVDQEALTSKDAERTVDVITANQSETEVLVRKGGILAPRLERRAADDLQPRKLARQALPHDAGFRLARIGLSGIDGLDWLSDQSPAPEAGEVRVAVSAAGLNFRDVMAATGLLPGDAEPDAAVDALGLEFAGTVVETAPDVSGLESGDRVLGLVRGALRDEIVVPAHGLWPLPPGLSATEAAGLPAAYLTAHYALSRLARLRQGERVLIHTATGGVGLAALALAEQAGAEIFATAGSAEKRAELAARSVRHVMDSRSLAFCDEILAATEGRGVDVVLNALPGAYVDKSLACLAPYGRFIELGKRDVHGDRPLGLKALKANISFHVVDLAAMIVDRPDLLSELWGELADLLRSKRIEAPPTTVFPASKVREAFRYFAAARQIGKVVVGLDDPDVEAVQRIEAPLRLDPNASYLVTGGSRGFGFAVARWLGQQGAGRLFLASRSGAPTEEVVPEIECLQRDGVEVVSIALDVADPAGVQDTIAAIAASDKPLRGIVHAAARYNDALLSEMSSAAILETLRPKVTGAWNLYRALQATNAKIDFLLLFSSLTQLLGWPGQSNYAAANAFLEGFASHCRAGGIPAQTINWGALGGSGFVARSAALARYLESAGMRPISDETALSALRTVLNSAEPVATFAGVDWAQLTSAHPALADAPSLSALTGPTTRQPCGQRAAIETAKGTVRTDLIRKAVTAQVARVLRSPPGSVDGGLSLGDLGIDSLSSFELRNCIEAALGLSLPLQRFQEASTIERLSALVDDVLSEAPDPDPDASSRPDASAGTHIDRRAARVQNGPQSGRSVAQSG
ncbi:MAG: SDR family NAD(P)-dependent oxidoreductase [Methyloligellaceae bacterium]